MPAYLYQLHFLFYVYGMKKYYFFLLLLASSFTTLIAQCVPDSTNYEFFSPTEENFPCIERNVAFNAPLNIFVPDSFAGVDVISAKVNGISGFPTGISYDCNPLNCTIQGGQRGCLNVSGTTTDTAGFYILNITAHVNTSMGNFSLVQLNSFGGPSPTYTVFVIEEGTTCHAVPSGISSFNKGLDAAMHISPNPNSGLFEVSIESQLALNGDLKITDLTGRMVYSQPVAVAGLYKTRIDLTTFSKGLYTVTLKTDKGFVVKKVMVE